jgi:guanylate kinase
MKRGRLVILSGPSGVGKTTVARRLLETSGFVRVVTATTRTPREGERQGVDYQFLSDAEFQARLAAGAFLEHARVHGHWYGTPREAAERALAAGKWALLAIDVQGARQLRDRAGDLPQTSVFLLPPDDGELRRRLLGRGTEGAAELDVRLANARAELAEKDRYDFQVVNRDVSEAVEEILGLLGGAGSPKR